MRAYGKTMRLIPCIIAMLAIATVPAMGIPWINEFHYDNVSTDVGEFIEIAGEAGTDLSDYTLYLYNGTGGAVYDTLALSGVLADQQNGFGTLAFDYPVNGIQNGPSDGFALFDSDSATVIQFLSYEGSFTAVDGVAIGLTSTDVGIAETTPTPVGHSMQLTGTGSHASDFTWSGPLAATKNGVNADQQFTCVSVPDFTPTLGILLLALAGMSAFRRLPAGSRSG
ncbi:MAG: hypothetical protein V1929_06225 [bacterium]